MSITSKIARAILRRPHWSPEEAAYKRLFQKGFRPDGIIDVGAFDGDWTRLVRRVFKNTPVLMVEPQPDKDGVLSKVSYDLSNVKYVQGLLGATAGSKMTFYQMSTGSSIMPEQSNVPRRMITLVSETLDRVSEGILGRLFLKIDVQGAELEVLRGGLCTLSRCDAVQLEVPMLPYNKGAPTFLEVVRFMDEYDFVPFDVSGFSRPNGVDTVQVDIIFVPKDSELRPRFFNFKPTPDL